MSVCYLFIYFDFIILNAFLFAVEIWQCFFAAECIAEVTSLVLTAKAPSYMTIMELDPKVHEFPLLEGVSSYA